MITPTLRNMRPFSSATTNSSILLNGHRQSSCYTSTPSSKSILRSFSSSHVRKDINAPTSTLPPPLETPVRHPDLGRFKYYWRTGRAYLKFYKTGVFAIKGNMDLLLKVEKAIQAKYGKRPFFQGKTWEMSTPNTTALQKGFLDRSDFQLILRTRRDLWKVPLFYIVLLICGEWMPLVTMAIPDIVPWTCRTPTVIDKGRTKLEERRNQIIWTVQETSPTKENKIVESHAPRKSKSIHEPHSYQKSKSTRLKQPRSREILYEPLLLPNSKEEYLHISKTLGLYSTLWDWVGGVPSSLMRKRVKKVLGYLRVDDMLLEREGEKAIKDGKISFEELKMALVDRGVDVMGRNEEELRDALIAWIRSLKTSSVPALLMARPNAWPSKPTIYRTNILKQIKKAESAEASFPTTTSKQHK